VRARKVGGSREDLASLEARVMREGDKESEEDMERMSWRRDKAGDLAGPGERASLDRGRMKEDM